MSPVPPRVLVVSGSAGHGHVMAARALVEALETRHPAIETDHIDAVEGTWSAYKHLYRWGYTRLVDKHPLLWRAVYDISNRSTSGFLHALTRMAGRRFLQEVERRRPGVVLCTHFLAPELLSGPVRSGRLGAEVHVVVTDHDIHRIWHWPGNHRYYVASDLVKARLALGYDVPEERIDVTGIPVRAAFAAEPDTTPVRIAYGLDPARPVVLFQSGGFAAGPMGQAILGIWHERRDVQVIAVCGPNERLRRRIARLPRPEGAALHALGFVQDVRGLMAVADVVVTKSGGITTSEVLAAGRPLLVSASIPGQEERNADFVLESGAGYRALTPEEVRWRVALLLEDADLRTSLGRRARHVARPHAAAAIADRVASVVLREEAVAGPRFHGI